jgi:hypothetical protein
MLWMITISATSQNLKKKKKKNPLNLTMRSQPKKQFISGKTNHKRLISNMGSLEGLTFCQFSSV